MGKDNKKIAKILKELPDTPGVYKMKNSEGTILYVGKAKDLKKRVSSYFREGYEHSTRTRSLLKHTDDIDYIITDSELEALILETNLIKELRPRYNIIMKDDKSFCYIKITTNEDYPRIRVVREREKRDAASIYIGPKTASNKVYDLLRILKKIMPFRHCDLNIEYNNRGKTLISHKTIEYPCLDYYIKRCPAPCIGAITPEPYKKIVQKLVSFLNGRQEEVIAELKQRMAKHANNKQFEQAARIRDQLFALEAMTQKQKMDDPNRVDTDIFNYYIEMGRIFINLFIIRNGKLINQENFVLDTTELTKESDVTAEEILSSFIKQYYEKTTDFPAEILIPEPLEGIDVFEAWLEHIAHKKIRITIPQKGMKNNLLLLSKKNAMTFAKQYRIKWLSEKADENAIHDLAEALELKDTTLKRIECFDISHLQGQDTVGSMVVFENGVPKKDHYRQFKLRTTQGKPDDFSSIEEVLTRRLKYLTGTDSTIVIRKALKKDDPALAEIQHDYIKGGFKTYWVVEHEKKLIGAAECVIHNDKIHEIKNLSINTQQVGYELLKKIIEKAKTKRIYIGTADRKFHEYFLEFGFEAVQKIPEPLDETVRAYAYGSSCERTARARSEANPPRQMSRASSIKKKTYFVYDKKKHQIDPSFSARPDLLVIDGGKPQLTATLNALKKLNLCDTKVSPLLTIPVIALAKKLEEIYLPHQTAPLLLEEGESALRLLQRMRDEAHRFAITAHRKLHGKRFR